MQGEYFWHVGIAADMDMEKVGIELKNIINVIGLFFKDCYGFMPLEKNMKLNFA